MQNDPEILHLKQKSLSISIEGVKYGIDKRHWHLGDEQGPGKTKQIIDLNRYPEGNTRCRATALLFVV